MKLRLLLITLFAIALAACDSPEQAATETAPDAEVTESAAEPLAEEEAAEIEALSEEAAEAEETQDDGADGEEIVLGAAPAAAPRTDWKYSEGDYFRRMTTSQGTSSAPDKIEVAEVFWYGCPHCYDLEPIINRWEAEKPANVRFVRVPAIWSDVHRLHAQLFYTEELLAANGKIKDPAAFRNAVFEEYHTRGNRLLTMPSITRLFERYGVSAEEFESTWSSFEVAQKLRVAMDLGRRYEVQGVPAVVVNGKYRTGGAEAGSYPRMLQVIDELVARESTE